MSDCHQQDVHLAGVLKPLMCVLFLLPASHTAALEIGFEGLLQIEASNNIEGANAPDEKDGNLQSGVLGVYGEQQGRRVRAAFSGELDVRKVSSSDDSDINSISRFLGAAEFKLTPRAWTWYVGDILGGIRADNAIQPIDNAEIERRNVFVTGPAFAYEQQGISRTEARALYVNQSENDDELESLYVANISHERDLARGSYYGIRFGNVYTDVPQAQSVASTPAADDFNRSSFGVFYNRVFGFVSVFGELGATRYDTDGESLDGLNAQVRLSQELGPQTTATVFIERDLNDQSLSAVESLIDSGDAAVGIAPDAAYFFMETRLGAEYSLQSAETSLDLGVGLAQLDFDPLSGGAQTINDAEREDRQQVFAYGSWTRRLNEQLRSELVLSYESQDFTDDRRDDESDSILLQARLIYGLSRSFDLQLGLTHDNASGIRTRLDEGVSTPEDIDITETRVGVGLRWAPPSRASKDLTVELKSLLE